MKELTKRDNFHGIIHFTLQLVLTILTGTAAYFTFYNFSLFISLPVLYLYFILYSWIGREGLFHELLHRTVFKSKQMNDILYKIVNIMGWMNGEYVRTSHLIHHRYTLFEDSDMDVALSLDFGKLDIFYALTFHFKQFIGEVSRLIHCLTGDFKTEFDKKYFADSESSTKRKIRNDSLLVLGTHLILLMIFILTKQWLLIVMIDFGAFFASWPHLLCSMTQHVGMQKEVNDFRLSSRSISLNPVGRFFYWDMNYHIEHHLYPAVPYHRLNELSHEIQYFLPEKHKGLWSAWKDILLYLRRRKVEEDYHLPVTLPK